MTRYTMSHWGTYEIAQDGGALPRLLPYKRDPDPSSIGLHQLSPDLMRLRVRRPAVRASWLEHGPGQRPHLRGHEPFVEVEWPQAIELVAREIDRVKQTHGNSAIFGGSYGWASAGRFHHAQSQIHRFLNTIGGYVRHADSYSLGAGSVIMPYVAGRLHDLLSNHHSWDVLARHTELFVTFGGVPLKNSQSSPGGVGRHRVRSGLQEMRQAGVRFVNVGPVSDNLDLADGVEWVALRPNTDTALMLGLAWTLQNEGLLNTDFLATHCTGYERFERYLKGATDGIPKTPGWASSLTGVPQALITRLARQMAGCRTMLNVQWSLQRASHGEQPFWMVVTLAAMLGQIGLPGGGFGVGYGASNSVGAPHVKQGGPTLPQGRNAVEQFIPVARISDMLLHPGQPFTYDGRSHRYPDIQMVYWAGGNPFHHHQDLNRLLKAWRKPATIVVHEQFWTATAKRADVVLPVTTAMENEDLGYASQEGVMVAMSRVTEPIGEALSDFEILRRLAVVLGTENEFTEGRSAADWLKHLYEQSRRAHADTGVDLPPYEAFREEGMIDLDDAKQSIVMFEEFRRDPDRFPLATPSGKLVLFSDVIESYQLADCPGHAIWKEPDEWLGSKLAEVYPLHLLTDQPRHKLHSQLDASAHSVGGKVDGREPVFMSAEDAQSRGIRHGEIVEVFNGRGSCLAGAFVTHQIMAGVVRMSTGSWYDPEAEGGTDKHGNPNVLTMDAGSSGLSQGCSAQTCLVQIRKPLRKPPPITAFELPEFSSGNGRTRPLHAPS